MISTREEYLAYLSQIQNPPFQPSNIPKNEKIYNINLDTRKVDSPTFLSVKQDQAAEFIWFKVDRFFENMDILDTVCVIQYINAHGDTYISTIPFYDKDTLAEDGKVIFPWVIKGPITAYSGQVQFAFQFFKLNRNPEDGTPLGYAYNLNTLPARSQILHSLALEQIEENVDPESNLVQQILEDITFLRQQVVDWDIYWDEIK